MIIDGQTTGKIQAELFSCHKLHPINKIVIPHEILACHAILSPNERLGD